MNWRRSYQLHGFGVAPEDGGDNECRRSFSAEAERRPFFHAQRSGATGHGQRAAEDARPPCAGVGDLDKTAWLCHECAAHLCRKSPKMPPRALANWNWGGREHPLYQNLTMGMRTLLGMGRLVMRMGKSCAWGGHDYGHGVVMWSMRPTGTDAAAAQIAL